MGRENPGTYTQFQKLTSTYSRHNQRGIMAFLLVLSPSKTQEIGEKYTQSTQPIFLKKTQILVKQLQAYSASELSVLMGMSEKLGKATEERYTSFSFPPAADNCRQALLAFRGDVFSEIEADDYSETTLSYAQDHLVILSGLYGVLRPLDLIQPYRLEMGGKVKPEGYNSLYDYWKDDITSVVNDALSNLEDPILLNLASAEYFKVVQKKEVSFPVVSASFKQNKAGKLRTIAVHAKKARGALAHYIIQNRTEKLSDLKNFNYLDYTFSEQHSSESEICYIAE